MSYTLVFMFYRVVLHKKREDESVIGITDAFKVDMKFGKRDFHKGTVKY